MGVAVKDASPPLHTQVVCEKSGALARGGKNPALVDIQRPDQQGVLFGKRYRRGVGCLHSSVSRPFMAERGAAIIGRLKAPIPTFLPPNLSADQSWRRAVQSSYADACGPPSR